MAVLIVISPISVVGVAPILTVVPSSIDGANDDAVPRLCHFDGYLVEIVFLSPFPGDHLGFTS
jgi:hypothetical protein